MCITPEDIVKSMVKKIVHPMQAQYICHQDGLVLSPNINQMHPAILQVLKLQPRGMQKLALLTTLSFHF